MSTHNRQSNRTWHPNVTVSAVCERDGKYLVVEEIAKSTGIKVINQPSGHLEHGESLVQAVVREVLEETQRHFNPESLLGLYRLPMSPQKTYLRYAFVGTVSEIDYSSERDTDILANHWLTLEELKQLKNLRSPLVLRCIDDYLHAPHYPLDVIKEL